MNKDSFTEITIPILYEEVDTDHVCAWSPVFGLEIMSNEHSKEEAKFQLEKLLTIEVIERLKKFLKEHE